MKDMRVVRLVSLLGVVLLLEGASWVQAQESAVSADIKIQKIDAKKVKTPEYQLSKGGTAQRSRDWYLVITTYKTNPDWMDELTFTYYILVKNKQSEGPKQLLLKEEVTYINIESGSHKSDIYLHPSTLARYGDVQGVAVVISTQGRVLAMDRIPSGSPPRWWERLTPTEGLLLNRMQTPFAMINFDDYEAVKVKK